MSSFNVKLCSAWRGLGIAFAANKGEKGSIQWIRDEVYFRARIDTHTRRSVSNTARKASREQKCSSQRQEFLRMQNAALEKATARGITLPDQILYSFSECHKFLTEEEPTEQQKRSSYMTTGSSSYSQAQGGKALELADAVKNSGKQYGKDVPPSSVSKGDSQSQPLRPHVDFGNVRSAVSSAINDDVIERFLTSAFPETGEGLTLEQMRASDLPLDEIVCEASSMLGDLSSPFWQSKTAALEAPEPKEAERVPLDSPSTNDTLEDMHQYASEYIWEDGLRHDVQDDSSWGMDMSPALEASFNLYHARVSVSANSTQQHPNMNSSTLMHMDKKHMPTITLSKNGPLKSTEVVYQTTNAENMQTKSSAAQYAVWTRLQECKPMRKDQIHVPNDCHSAGASKDASKDSAAASLPFPGNAHGKNMPREGISPIVYHGAALREHTSLQSASTIQVKGTQLEADNETISGALATHKVGMDTQSATQASQADQERSINAADSTSMGEGEAGVVPTRMVAGELEAEVAEEKPKKKKEKSSKSKKKKQQAEASEAENLNEIQSTSHGNVAAQAEMHEAAVESQVMEMAEEKPKKPRAKSTTKKAQQQQEIEAMEALGKVGEEGLGIQAEVPEVKKRGRPRKAKKSSKEVEAMEALKEVGAEGLGAQAEVAEVKKSGRPRKAKKSSKDTTSSATLEAEGEEESEKATRKTAPVPAKEKVPVAMLRADEKQQARAIAESLGCDLPDQILYSISDCRNFIETHTSGAVSSTRIVQEPTEKQIKWAKTMASDLSIEVPQSCLVDRFKMSKFLSENKKAMDRLVEAKKQNQAIQKHTSGYKDYEDPAKKTET